MSWQFCDQIKRKFYPGRGSPPLWKAYWNKYVWNKSRLVTHRWRIDVFNAPQVASCACATTAAIDSCRRFDINPANPLHAMHIGSNPNSKALFRIAEWLIFDFFCRFFGLTINIIVFWIHNRRPSVRRIYNNCWDCPWQTGSNNLALAFLQMAVWFIR